MEDEEILAIKIVDSIMGSGKTEHIIDLMNSEMEQDNIIYITPYIDEVKRIKDRVISKRFYEPKEKEEIHFYSKSASLKYMLKNSYNIATTHALFKIIDNETEDLLEASNYVLVLDEVLDVISHVELKKADLHIVFEGYKLLEADDDGTVRLGSGAKAYMELGGGKFDYLLSMAKLERLFLFQDTILLWEFPVSVFKHFKDVYILTYLFDGQIQKHFFDYYKVDYTKFSIINTDNVRKLVPYDKKYDEARILDLKSKIDIYDGKYNTVGESPTSLSFNWYKTKTSSVKEVIGKNVYNFFRHEKGLLYKDCIWTSYKNSIKVANYAKSFIPHNLRATNDYSDTKAVAYCVNRYVSPFIDRYFSEKGIIVNHDIYALSEMLQLIWRSGIRNNEPISVYIPSKRMRELLIKFLNKEFN